MGIYLQIIINHIELIIQVLSFFISLETYNELQDMEIPATLILDAAVG